MKIDIAKYSKAIAAGVAAIGVAVADGIFDFNDAWQIAAAILSAVGLVYAAPANHT